MHSKYIKKHNSGRVGQVGLALCLLLLLFADAFKLGLPLSLLLRVLDEEADHLCVRNLLSREHFVEVALELLPTLLDVLGAVVGDAKDLTFGEGGAALANVLQEADFALLEGLVHISEVTVPGLEGPLLVSVEVAE